MDNAAEIFELMLAVWNTDYSMHDNTDYKLGVLRTMWDFCCFTVYIDGMSKVEALRHEVINGAEKGRGAQ